MVLVQQLKVLIDPNIEKKKRYKYGTGISNIKLLVTPVYDFTRNNSLDQYQDLDIMSEFKDHLYKKIIS